MIKSSNKKEIYTGMVLIGATGVLIGLVIDSPLLMAIAGFLGMVIGGFVGWLGGRRYMVIICLGVLIGAYFGNRTGDRDILIIAAGTGGAWSGARGGCALRTSAKAALVASISGRIPFILGSVFCSATGRG